ncbi:MATE family efflux transporter [Halalkalibacter kiskunsagensis]|uniref:MATE family efflux transporter n=1 Tax=Halalkalibacter kiskunsagensis TaxID=1548599 RepID=A0ABV6KKB2_9BACI
MNKSEVHKLSLFAITWPIFIESFLHMTLRTADTFMLSKVSDDAVAAVGVSNQIVMLLFFLFQVGATGAAVVIAQYLGAKKYSEIRKFTWTAISFNFLFGLLISLTMVIFSKTFLGFFNLEPELFDQARMFLLIVGGGLFLQAMMLTISAIIQAHGFTRDTMFVTVGMNIINIFGNYVLIFGALGFPQLGVTGVAISTVVSQFLGLSINFILLFKRVDVRLHFKDMIDWQKDRFYKILSVGIPSGIGQLSYSMSQIVTTGFIVVLGPEMLTTRIYTLNILLFIIVISISLGRGTQIIVGHMIGAGDFEKANKEALKNLRLSMLLCLGVALILVLVREQVMGLFTENPLIIYTGATLLLMGVILEPGRCFNIVLGQAIQAAGDARYLMMSSIITIWGFSVPMYYLLGIHWGFGLIGIWIAFIADEWLRGLILYRRWKSRAWEKKVLVQQEKNISKVTG